MALRYGAAVSRAIAVRAGLPSTQLPERASRRNRHRAGADAYVELARIIQCATLTAESRPYNSRTKTLPNSTHARNEIQ
jgi:hypothetical protein